MKKTVNTEPTNNEEIVEEIQEQVDDTQTENPEDISLQLKIEMWKKEFKNNVFVTTIDDEAYYWRKLKRSEYKEIAMYIESLTDIPDQIKHWLKQDEITKAVLLYPDNAEEVIEESAGIASIISQDCLARSGFGAFSHQVL